MTPSSRPTACVIVVFYVETVSRTVSEIFCIKRWRDLEIGVRGRLRSLKMAQIDATYYWSALLGLFVCKS